MILITKKYQIYYLVLLTPFLLYYFLRCHSISLKVILYYDKKTNCKRTFILIL